MKWLVGILVLVNLGMFGWILTDSSHSKPADRTAIYNHSIRPAIRLKLLAEVDKLEYLADAQQTQGKVPPPATEPSAAQLAKHASQSKLPDQLETTEQDLEPRAQHSASVDSADVQQPATVASQSSGDGVDTGPQPSETEPTAAPPTESQPSVSANFVTPNCFTIGPFAQKQSASEMAENLAALGIKTSNRETSQRQSVGFWVYLPPFGSREQARNMEKLLEQKGVKDFLIIPSGVMENAISLGVFSRRTTAARRVGELRESGINALIKQNFDITVLYWLDFSSPNETPLPAAMLEKIQQKHNGIGIIKHSCE